MNLMQVGISIDHKVISTSQCDFELHESTSSDRDIQETICQEDQLELVGNLHNSTEGIFHVDEIRVAHSTPVKGLDYIRFAVLPRKVLYVPFWSDSPKIQTGDTQGRRDTLSNKLLNRLSENLELLVRSVTCPVLETILTADNSFNFRTEHLSHCNIFKSEANYKNIASSSRPKETRSKRRSHRSHWILLKKKLRSTKRPAEIDPPLARKRLSSSLGLKQVSLSFENHQPNT